jgi:putative sigma-54 modulation protein
MKITYRGIAQQLPAQLQKRVDVKFGKLSKLLERRGEKEAHVAITTERHLHNAEITLQFYDHQLVGEGSDTDLYTAMSLALDKLETQAVKQRGKWREKARRHNGNGRKPVVAEPAETARGDRAGAKSSGGKAKLVAVATEAGRRQDRLPHPASAPAQRVFRVNHLNRRKPMTLDEAMMEMEGGREYMVYRDSDRECVSVLVRRRDGNFDLIES